jgi:hypothetical protein
MRTTAKNCILKLAAITQAIVHDPVARETAAQMQDDIEDNPMTAMMQYPQIMSFSTCPVYD